MKILHHLLLLILSTSPFLCVNAKPLTVFFGTSGRGSEGIYQATFNPKNGKFTPSKLAAKIGSPGFLALHPNGKILYSIGRWEDGSGALGYHIQKNGALEEFSRMICPDGGSAHIAVHPSGNFLLTAQYGGGSVALFPLDRNGKLGEPTVIEHHGGSKVVDKRQDSPHPHWTGFSPDGNFALIPDLGLDQIVIYKVHSSKPVITRALNKLSALGYLRRERDVADRRNIFITRTPKGAEFLDAFHHFIAGTARDDRHDNSKAERTA